jgi:hypothetical protein
MTAAQLRCRYTEVFGEPPHSRHRTWLIKRIAWRLQALAEGDLSERARRRSRELARDADLRLSAPRTPRATPVEEPVPQADAPLARDPRLPPPGHLLLRRYKGQLLQVRVLADGFEYQEQVFASLSAVAKAITGSHTNGFLFFRLPAKGGGA